MSDSQPDPVDLLETARDEPAAVDLDATASVLDSKRGTDRTAALKVFAAVAHHDPDWVLDHVDRMVDALDDPVLVTSTTAAMAVTVVARERPEAVTDAVPTLVSLLDEDPPLLRFRAATALVPVLEAFPETFAPHATALVATLREGPTVDDGSPEDEADRTRMATQQSRGTEAGKDAERSERVREFAANALVEVAQTEPDALSASIDDLVTLAADDDAQVRGAIVETLRYLAEDDPSSVTPAESALIARLEDDAEFVRARAVRALGYAEAANAVEPLRALADRESDETIAETARDTAEWVASNT